MQVRRFFFSMLLLKKNPILQEVHLSMDFPEQV